MEGVQAQQDEDAPLPPEDPVPGLPDFDLEDEEVRLAIVEAAGYYRGYWHGKHGTQIPNREDSRKLMEFYLKAGLMDSLEEFPCSDEDPVIESDENGNLQMLTIGYGSLPYRVPHQIVGFERLRTLTLYGKCRRISNRLHDCTSLEELGLYDVEIDEPFLLPPGINFFLLEDMDNTQCTEHVITSLKLYSPLSKKAPHEGLELLKLNSCQLTEHHVEDILFNVIPNFPNLKSLVLSGNKIESLAAVSTRLRSMAITDESFISTNFPEGLKNFHLSGNPLMAHCRVIAKQNANGCNATSPQNSVIQLLSTLPSITDIDCDEADLPRIKYQLDLNRARIFLVSKANAVQGNALIPLSLWPKILEKAVQHEYRSDSRRHRTVGNFDGMYYLLRYGPALCANFDATENENRQSNSLSQKKRKRCQGC